MSVLKLEFGNVKSKRIETPNDFVSHMVEHLAWRLGCSIDLTWDNQDWLLLGQTLGRRIGTFEPRRTSAAALGMLDDGSAEALVELGGPGALNIEAGAGVDLPWFLSLRCEQLSSGQPLVDLLTGLTQGIPAAVSVVVGSLEDPHHTWEGVFRAVGVALSRIFTPAEQEAGPAGLSLGEINRQTAESGLSVVVDFEHPGPSRFQYEGPEIEHYRETGALVSFGEILDSVGRAAGFSAQVDFSSKALSSGHVLLEDTGMALGQALRQVLVDRMMSRGINGAGDSLAKPSDFYEQKIRVAVSVEGRKFWRFVPLNTTYDDLRRRLIIGQTIMKGLYSEDLDDFLDGLSWGLGCSIVVHVKELPPPEEAWGLVFKNLGLALKGVFEPNPYRRGVPPGVKANLS